MSRIGKLPITIPPNVDVQYQNAILQVKGPFGRLETKIPKIMDVIQTKDTLRLHLTETTKNVRALHGLYRTLLHNMVIGVSEQFTINLLLKGVGYRAAVQGKEMNLSLGYSHPIRIQIPETISVEVTQNTTITLKSCNKEELGLFASNVRSWRLPEPYKGKGILYENEEVIRKAGKSAK